MVPLHDCHHLQDGAAATASWLLITLLVVLGPTLARAGNISSRRAGAAGLFLVVSTNFANQVIEGFVNVDTSFRRGLDETAVEMVGKVSTLWMERG